VCAGRWGEGSEGGGEELEALMDSVLDGVRDWDGSGLGSILAHWHDC
jgi:hypothetical protein